MSSSAIDLLATEARFGAQNYQPIGVVLTRGEGVWVWDTEGNRHAAEAKVERGKVGGSNG